MDESRNYAKERLSEDMMPVFPADKIECTDCRYRKKGTIGYKNGYCEMYPRGKPNGILFDGNKCQFKEKGAPA